MPPKTSRRPMSRGPMDQLRQSVAQRSAATASRGASDHEVAPPPLELQLITGQVPSTQHSSATSTFTTGRSFPRSIRCKSGDTSTSTSASTHTRGIVVGKKTSEEVRKHGKIKLEWSDELKLPSSQVVQARLIRDIGSVVRGKVPMVAHSYWALPREHLQIVYNHISTYYDFSYENIALFEYIQKMASLRFINWMSECKEHFNTYGTDVPVEFVDRVDEWTWLMAHWSTEEAKWFFDQIGFLPNSRIKATKVIVDIARKHLKPSIMWEGLLPRLTRIMMLLITFSEEDKAVLHFHNRSL
ncbi:hypothetical protein LguiA_007486 [Lonicera macranthoides]